MLRLTVTVVQIMNDARVLVSVHQEDPYGEGPGDELGSVVETYDMSWRLDQYDELTALCHVLREWSSSVVNSTK